MDCWSKKGLLASFLAISASFFSLIRHTPQYLLLIVYQIPHLHTGVMLAERLMILLKQWKIEASKVLMVVTDNGSSMIKAFNRCKQLLKKQAKAADETTDSGSGKGTNSNGESVNETEADDADVIVDTDSDDDVPESVKRRKRLAQESSEVEGSVSEPSTESEVDNSHSS
jgi:hypothetical protein